MRSDSQNDLGQRSYIDSATSVRSSAFVLSVARRFLVIVAISFWLGGFTFYAGVAVPVGMRVLGSHVRQGFITQQVTLWLNFSSIFALSILAWNVIVLRNRAGKLIKISLAASLLLMITLQVELFALHPYLDRLLDAETRRIIDDERFDLLHHVYLWTSTVQWLAGVFHTLCLAAILKD